MAALVYSMPAAAVVSLLLAWICRRLLPKSFALRYSLSLPMGAGVMAGYVLLPDWAPLIPSQYWHYIPYLILLAMLLGPLVLPVPLWSDQAGVAQGRGHVWWLIGRLILLGVLVLLAAWLLVPTWPDLEPRRPAIIALLAAYFGLLMVFFDLLTHRAAPAALLGAFSLSAATVAVTVAVPVSLMFGTLGALAAASAAGCWLIGIWIPHDEHAMRGIIPVFVLAAAGPAFVGAINPEPPLWDILVIPAVPLLLWLFPLRSSDDSRGRERLIIQLLVIGAALLAVAAWILLVQT